MDYTSAKYDEVLTQFGRLNDKNFSLTTDVKSLKHDLSTTQKSANESQTYYHVVRLIFFANMYGKDTESALPLLNLLDLLSVENIFALHYCIDHQHGHLVTCLKELIFVYLYTRSQLSSNTIYSWTSLETASLRTEESGRRKEVAVVERF